MATIIDSDTLEAARALRAKKNGSARAVPTRFMPCTDMGNAERLVAQHGVDMRFETNLGWLVWTGTHWERDATNEVERRAKMVVRNILSEAGAIEEDGVRKAVSDWARKSESKERVRAMVALAESEIDVVARAEQFDADAWLFNAGNGTVDLRTGVMHEHRRESLITKLTRVHYDPLAKCPTFEAFLNRVLGGSEALCSFIRRFMGYCLTGDVREQVLLFCYGAGANGKSTFIDLMIELFGSHGGYAMPAAPGLLVAKKHQEHPTALADLRGARLVSCVEIGDGKRFDEERVKSLTGGDAIKARYMREDFFTFAPSFKLILAANHKPQVRGTDLGIWRRILLMPFTVTIPDADKDRALPMKLRAELPGILAWAVRGCLEWQQQGLSPPDVVTEATRLYRAEQDQVGRFIDEECTRLAAASCMSGPLYGSYKRWCARGGEEAITATAFARALEDRDIEGKKTNKGKLWRGIGLNQDENSAESEDE